MFLYPERHLLCGEFGEWDVPEHFSLHDWHKDLFRLVIVKAALRATDVALRVFAPDIPDVAA